MRDFFLDRHKQFKLIIENIGYTELDDSIEEWKETLYPYLSDAFRVRLRRLKVLDHDTISGLVNVISQSFSTEVPTILNHKDISKIEAILEDMIFKYSIDSTSKESFEALKLLKAKEENLDFEENLALMICGDSSKNFPYRSSSFLTKFFQHLGYDFVHDGSTRRVWVQNRLEELSIKEIHSLISKGLFKKKYFVDFYKNNEELTYNEAFKNAIEEFKEFIQSSIVANEAFDLSRVLDMNVNLELLFDKEATTEDEVLNNLIEEAKERFFNPKDKHTSLKKLWDAFERIKTYYSSEGLNKAQSADKLSTLASVDFDKEQIDNEFKILTAIGNSYRIRHHEQGKKELSDTHANYLFFRMLSLIDLCLRSLAKEEESIDIF